MDNYQQNHTGMTVIFDIGKTNKKCFVFDEAYRVVYQEYARFAEQQDEDGFPCDDLPAIVKWVQSQLQQLMHDERFTITAVNFSTYGASLVHLDRHGKPLLPLVNYLKPYPAAVQSAFYEKYGPAGTFTRQTASPQLGMLNSGLQLYWLKHQRPGLFAQIRCSLHFPQYLSYLLTGIPVSEFTSIGCHTALWDYEQKDYHDWVYAEGIDRVLPPIVATTTSINTLINGQYIKVGVGVHDSSSALLPYLKASRKPFVLLSTGTWSIALNPFSTARLTDEELQWDCLNFLRIDGDTTRAARLFLGKELSTQVAQLEAYFGEPAGAYKKVRFDAALYQRLQDNFSARFHFRYINQERAAPEATNLDGVSTFVEAYHQLMLELAVLQITAVERAMCATPVRTLYIDGGFANNELFVRPLAQHFAGIKVRTTQSPLGSALGAAMLLANRKNSKKWLKHHYSMQKIKGMRPNDALS